jgi:beta-phosphoglucomutase-like phosphatase (HAD superfamily)
MKQNIEISNDVKALIFDCDGTLVDSMPLHMMAWKEAFGKYNYKYEEEFLFSVKGMKETEIIKLYNTTFHTDLDPEMLVSAKHDVFLNHIAKVKPIEPILNIALWYYNKLPLAVVSGSVQEIVYGELKTVGILHLFESIITADDPLKPKPEPDTFIETAKRLKVSPSDCIVFEDGDSGLEAAAKAGMKTINIREYVE